MRCRCLRRPPVQRRLDLLLLRSVGTDRRDEGPGPHVVTSRIQRRAVAPVTVMSLCRVAAARSPATITSVPSSLDISADWRPAAPVSVSNAWARRVQPPNVTTGNALGCVSENLCPWNVSFPRAQREPAFAPREGLDSGDARALARESSRCRRPSSVRAAKTERHAADDGRARRALTGVRLTSPATRCCRHHRQPAVRRARPAPHPPGVPLHRRWR